MSVFRPQTVPCPSCGRPFVFEVCKSVNADRRPDLRQAILDGDFQADTCPACGAALRLAPELTYLDAERGLWALVQPASKLEHWTDLEAQAVALFQESYGPDAPALVREIGAGLKARITFGWAGLREKIVCAGAGLDDVTLELLKVALLRSLDDPPLADDTESRLVEVDGDTLVLAWVRAADEAVAETLRVPRGLYDQIAADGQGWGALRHDLSAGPFVDVHRLLVPAPTDPDAGAGDDEGAPA